MPVGYHHYYYRDFLTDLRTAGQIDAVALLEGLRVEEEVALAELRRIKNQRRALADQVLSERYATLRPHLRPCFQKRFDLGKREVEITGDWI